MRGTETTSACNIGTAVQARENPIILAASECDVCVDHMVERREQTAVRYLIAGLFVDRDVVRRADEQKFDHFRILDTHSSGTLASCAMNLVLLERALRSDNHLLSGDRGWVLRLEGVIHSNSGDYIFTCSF